MIVLDTNIVSELMKTRPDIAVFDWVNQQSSMTLFITTITIAEITYGLHALPVGQRRSFLEKAFSQVVDKAFKHRVLSFDEKAAHVYGMIMAKRKATGKPLGVPDGQIAAIAHAHGFSIATRNIQDFTNCDITLLNPFEPGAKL